MPNPAQYRSSSCVGQSDAREFRLGRDGRRRQGSNLSGRVRKRDVQADAMDVGQVFGRLADQAITASGACNWYEKGQARARRRAPRWLPDLAAPEGWKAYDAGRAQKSACEKPITLRPLRTHNAASAKTCGRAEMVKNIWRRGPGCQASPCKNDACDADHVDPGIALGHTATYPISIGKASGRETASGSTLIGATIARATRA